MVKIEKALKVAWLLVGKPYIWGGDDAIKGFDCSGLIIEILKSVGRLPRSGDWSAAMLYEKFKKHEVESPETGCLAFWSNENGHIIHVEFCVDFETTIGASGGGSKTKTEQDAIDQNAYVKVRPLEGGRKKYSHLVNPFYEDLD